LSDAVDRHPLVVRPSMPSDRIMAMFQALGLRYILTCSPRGRIVGIIKKKDLLSFLANHHIGTRK
jgi:CBS-domain-containing membrane protein